MRTADCCWIVAALIIGSPLSAVFAEEPHQKAEGLFQKLDTNGDGRLTADEVGEEQGRFFDRLVRVGDADDNAELSREEFLKALKREHPPAEGVFGGDRRRGRGRSDFDPKRMLERLDTNNDDMLSRDELPQPLRERLGPLFERLGTDELSLEDLERMSRQRGSRRPLAGRGDRKPGDEPRRPGRSDDRGRFAPPGGERFGGPRFLRLLDADGDHRISKEELAKAGDMFDELDENEDGKLEVRELMGPPPLGDRRGPDADRPAPPRERGRRPGGPEGERRPPRAEN